MALLQAISNILYIDGGTATHLGLQAVLEEFNDYARPVEKGFPRVAFVLTDGRSNDFTATVRVAAELHTANIEVYAVAIGGNVNYNELYEIATAQEKVLNTTLKVAQLKELQEFLVRKACKGKKHALNTLLLIYY